MKKKKQHNNNENPFLLTAATTFTDAVDQIVERQINSWSSW